MNVKEYQLEILNTLMRIFPDQEIIQEWFAEMNKYNLYSPRLDLAIGPFAKNQRLIEEYDRLQVKHQSFIEGLIRIHNNNLQPFYNEYPNRDYYSATNTNQNARCFIAIEIENSVSRKHLIGGAINASALGRFGLFIAFTEEKFNAMKKLEGYFQFLSKVGKNTFNTNNLLILFKDQFTDYINNTV